MPARLHYILTLFLLLFAMCLNAQVGTEFWFAAPDVISGHGDSPVVIRVTALNEDANVKISLPAAGVVIREFSVTANTQESNTVFYHNSSPYNLDAIENTPANNVNQKGILITSDKDITVLYDVTNGSNPDRFTLKADNALGNEFYIPSQYDYGNVQYAGYSSDPPYEQVNIVATEDGTVVEITPAVSVEGHDANTTYAVSLNRGETYCIKGISGDVDYTLSGTHITSNNDIAVTISDDSVFDGSDINSTKGTWDLIGDQIVPVSECGTEYIAMFSGKANIPVDENDLSKGWIKQSTEKVYVLATEDNTTVLADFSDSEINMPYELNAGESISLDIENLSSIHITANLPIYVYQVSGLLSGSTVYNELGSVILPPLGCSGSQSVTFKRTLTESFYVQILTKYENIGSFTFDSSSDFNPNDISIWTRVPNTGNEGDSDTWYFTNQSVNIYTVIPYILSNSKGLFHFSVIEQNSGSASFCYYSEFNRLISNGMEDACDGDVITLTADRAEGTYAWYEVNHQGQVLSTEQNLEVTESGIYWVAATRTFESGGSCSLADTVVVNFKSLPSFNLGDDLTLCSNEQVNIVPDFDDTIDSTDLTYEWMDGTTTSSYTLLPDSGSAFEVVELKVDDSNGCSARDTVVISVAPDFDIDIANDGTTLYDSSLSNASSLIYYQWRYGSSTSSTILDTASYIVADEAGWYYLSATNGFGCNVIDSINFEQIDEPTNLVLQSLSADYTVYPNPATEILHIKQKKDSSTNTCAYFYNVDGQLVKIYPLVLGDNTIDVSDLSAGLYCIKVGEESEFKINIK